MQLTVVGTGSSGNSYVLRNDGRRLILDAGMPWKDIQVACDFDMQSVDGCLISHQHGDHSYSIKSLQHNAITCYTGAKAVEPIYEVTGAVVKPLISQKWNRVGAWAVTPVEVHHDVPCYGFLIRSPSGDKVLYATDFSYVGVNGKEYTFKNLALNHFLIAINRSADPDDTAKNLKHIHEGHSSLENVADFLESSITDECVSIVACHLSERNADETMILDHLRRIAPKAKVLIAKKGMKIDL